MHGRSIVWFALLLFSADVCCAQSPQANEKVQVIITGTGQRGKHLVTQTLFLNCEDNSVFWEIRGDGNLPERSSGTLQLESRRLEKYVAQLKLDLDPDRLMPFHDEDHTCRYTFAVLRDHRLEWSGSIGEGDFRFGLKSSRIMTPLLHAIQTKREIRGGFLYAYFLSDYSFKYRSRGYRVNQEKSGESLEESRAEEAEQSIAPEPPS
ncbi:hypothetical protein Enr13x_20060 [Stieleria neptunia]|uniref:Uncharacterized protein n=1 Tax=Stieleria neptunia TaxID=2527979 RepID=A0A518HMU2_9BACT|nr:hypothetical protein [Stieleria neptunia]QDV42163.1 hypothetical protein Enr13x_20060 [Stieleria neptunia]